MVEPLTSCAWPCDNGPASLAYRLYVHRSLWYLRLSASICGFARFLPHRSFTVYVLSRIFIELSLRRESGIWVRQRRRISSGRFYGFLRRFRGQSTLRKDTERGRGVRPLPLVCTRRLPGLLRVGRRWGFRSLRPDHSPLPR